jgi:hypothetical protein
MDEGIPFGSYVECQRDILEEVRVMSSVLQGVYWVCFCF